MTAPGSVWQRLAADVDTGRALELSTDRYTPTPEMVEHVKAVDGVCRGPGCQVPADRCDVDHLVPWPAGRTHVSNLDSLSRGCHNGKTARSLAGPPRRRRRDLVDLPRRSRLHHLSQGLARALRDPGSGSAPSWARRLDRATTHHHSDQVGRRRGC